MVSALRPCCLVALLLLETSRCKAARFKSKKSPAETALVLIGRNQTKANDMTTENCNKNQILKNQSLGLDFDS